MSVNAVVRQATTNPQNRRFLLTVVPYRNRSATTAAASEADSPALGEVSSSVRPFEDIPGPVSLPVIGTLWQYRLGFLSVLEYHKSLEKLHAKYGPVCRQRLGNNEVINFFDPEDIRTFFQTEGNKPYIKPLQESVQFYRKEKGIAPGLGNVNGDEWLKLRAAVRQLMLRPKEVAHFLPQTELAANAMVERLDRAKIKDGSLPDLWEVVGKWLQESAGYVAFDRSLGCLAGGKTEATAQEVLIANRDIFYLAGILQFSLPVYRYIKTPKFRRIIKAENVFIDTTKAYVKETMDQIDNLVKEGNLGGRYPFMTYLLGRSELSIADITQMVQSLLADGLTSSRPALMSSLQNLATNPEAQEKAYQEVKEVVGEARVVTTQMLGQLTYLKAVFKETFRLHPVGTEISRITQKDTVLANYKIPKDTHIHLNPTVNAYKEEYFPEPNKFLPERWLRGQESNIHPYTVLPFGHGPRSCIGRRFAEQDLLVGIVKILQRFELRHPDNKPMEFVYHTLLAHKHPVKVQFIPRR